MPPNWNMSEMVDNLGKEEYDRITNHPEDAEKWHPVTNAILCHSLAIGLNHIHKDNVGEWIDRINALQGVSGHDLAYSDPYPEEDDIRIWITRADIENHIGLRTDVSRASKTAFYASLFQNARNRGSGAAKRQDVSAHAMITEIYKQKEKHPNEQP